ncbi:MAG: hypothetical protein ACJATO_000797 [Arenicella sp.]|jgi:hypothetical protein
MNNQNEVTTQKKKSNAKVAFFVALIPVMLFVASFFIQR